MTTTYLSEQDLQYALKVFEQLLPSHPDPKLVEALQVLRARVEETSWPDRTDLSTGYQVLVEDTRARLDAGKPPTREQGAALLQLLTRMERERIDERTELAQARHTSERLAQLITNYNRLQSMLRRAGLEITKPMLRAGWGYQINGGTWVGVWSEDWRATEAGLAALIGRELAPMADWEQEGG